MDDLKKQAKPFHTPNEGMMELRMCGKRGGGINQGLSDSSHSR